MPKLNSKSTALTNNGYTFNGTSVDDLGATEYTIVTILVDVSGSLNGQERELERMVREVVKTLNVSPRKDNLLVRVVKFNEKDSEVHGFKLLSQININDYDNTISCSGSTCLYDAVINAITATDGYVKTLHQNDYFCNGLIFIITDGEDVGSSNQPSAVATGIANLRKTEMLESLNVILIGMTGNVSSTSLTDFQQQGGLSGYIEFGTVNHNSLGKLASFISKSITVVSQSLGSGSAPQIVQSKSLSF